MAKKSDVVGQTLYQDFNLLDDDVCEVVNKSIDDLESRIQKTCM
jgi:hypothetical protein